MVALPRLVIAAPASGHGKTTVATGLMAALKAAGHQVSGHKVGPDYIDPGYHALATGRPGRNLDPHLVGESLLAPLLVHGASTPSPADIAIIEGVMGLYDGAIGGEGFASTAHVATVLKAPVVLVIDISHASRSIAAVVHGMASFDTGLRIAGVILNKAGSQRHAGEVISALEATGIDVLGVLSRDDAIAAPSRHLGLVPVDERADAAASLSRSAALIAERVDLEAVVRIARSAPDLGATGWDPAAALGEAAGTARDAGRGTARELAPLVAIAGGRAFTFRYAETEELLRAAGCRTALFDPMADTALPEGTAGIYLGGGFPEVHASALTANVPLRHALADAIASGVPTVAECAGLLYLCRTVDGHPMVGALDAEGAMTSRLTLSYHDAIAPQDTLLAVAGSRVAGHEFHRTTVTASVLSGPGEAAWLLRGTPAGFSADPAGTGHPTLHASYLHTHWAGYPQVAARFARAVQQATPWRPGGDARFSTGSPPRSRSGHPIPIVAASPPGGRLRPGSATYRTGLPVAGRAVTVFGGEGTALGHIAALRDAGALVTVVATDVVASVADLAARNLVGWRPRSYLPSDLDGSWLVVAATGDADLDEHIAAEAESRRLWCLSPPAGPVTAPAGGIGQVTLVGGGPGDPGLLTVAGRDALRAADVVVTDRLAPLAALTELRADALVIDVGKVPHGRATPQEQINRLLIGHATAGRAVVRLKGGDSFLFGRGGEELQACSAAGLDVRVIPGVTSALAVPAAAGIPVTHRGLNQGFTVVSGHVPPDDPRSTVNYGALAGSGTDLVLLMAVATLPAITRALVEAGLDPGTPAATIADGTLPSQRVIRATVSTIAAQVVEAGIGAPAITVIGAVAGFGAPA